MSRQVSRGHTTDKPDKAMRAAITRAHRAEREARRVAQTARKESERQPPSRVKWNRRPGELRALTAAELRIRDRVELQRQERGDDGEGMRAAERIEIETRWDHKRHGTPATLEHATRTQTGPLARLYLSAAIDAVQLDAAVEIATIAERIGSDVSVRTASLETRIDAGRFGGEAFETLGRVRREMAYTQWRASLGNARPLVMAMVIGDIGGTEGPIGYSVAAKRYRTSARKAKAALIDALDLWPRILGDIRRTVDEDDLARANARVA